MIADSSLRCRILSRERCVSLFNGSPDGVKAVSARGAAALAGIQVCRTYLKVVGGPLIFVH